MQHASFHIDSQWSRTTLACALAAALAVQAASPNAASGRTVYDAGKALRQNCESGSYANPCGVWSYHTAATVAPFTGLADFPAHSKMESDTMDGWICLSGENPAHPLLLVNATGDAVSSYCSSGNQLEADELMFHPSAYGYVTSSAADLTTVSALNVTVLTWQPVKQYRSAKLLVSSQHSLSVSRVHS